MYCGAAYGVLHDTLDRADSSSAIYWPKLSCGAVYRVLPGPPRIRTLISCHATAKKSCEVTYRELQDIPGRADSDLPPSYWPECPVKHTKKRGRYRLCVLLASIIFSDFYNFDVISLIRMLY